MKNFFKKTKKCDILKKTHGGGEMFRNLFNPESPLMVTMSQVTDCIFLSLFYVVGCFPVITVGASTAALYDAVYYAFRRKDKHSWQRFGSAYLKNLKASILPGLVYLVLMGAIAWGTIQLWNGAVYGTVSWAIFAAGAFAALVAVGILSVMFPLLSRFETGFVQLLRNTVFLALANLPRTLCLAVVNTAAILLCIRLVAPLFILPALSTLITTLFLEPMFKPFMPKEEPEEQ